MSSIDRDEIRMGLKQLIVERLNLDVEAESIGDEDPLFANPDDPSAEGGLALDSVEALEIVVGIEERWGVVIQDDSMANEFYSIESLAGLVCRLLSESDQEALSA
jgi:acyl carrier protein